MTSEFNFRDGYGQSAPVAPVQLTQWTHNYQQEQENAHPAYPAGETDVLPPYEGRCPVDPHDDSTETPQPTGRNQDAITIGTQRGDNLGGNWFIISQLGEGTFGAVKLIEDVHQRRLLAMKWILTPSDEAEQTRINNFVQREILLHKYLYHENVIRFIASRRCPEGHCIFLEYACGGELFDRIEPDIGVPRDSCHRWFLQLIDGLDYLHQRGIVHRDIKPENLLLSEKDELKISDFGLASIFRMNGRVRKVKSRCGTQAYVAPEVYLEETFHAQPLDIWSAGIVLTTLIGGEMPWAVAETEDDSYCLWKMASLSAAPWNKLPSECLALLKKMLDPNPDTRATVAQVRANHWFRRGFTDRALGAPPPKRFHYDIHVSSVPQRGVRDYPTANGSSADEPRNLQVFSQPVRLEDLLLSQTQGVECLVEQSPFARMVKRITRFYISCSVPEVIETLSGILDQLHMNLARTSPGLYTVTCQDRHKGPMTFKVSFVQNHNKLLMDFRMSKGNGLEFKRIFAVLREKLDHIVADDPVAWTVTAKEPPMAADQ